MDMRVRVRVAAPSIHHSLRPHQHKGGGDERERERERERETKLRTCAIPLSLPHTHTHTFLKLGNGGGGKGGGVQNGQTTLPSLLPPPPLLFPVRREREKGGWGREGDWTAEMQGEKRLEVVAPGKVAFCMCNSNSLTLLTLQDGHEPPPPP